MRRRVIIESPFKGANLREREQNMAYLDECIRHSALVMGEAPFASHGIYPGPLEEDVPEERKAGIECGYAWWTQAECVVFYTDRGWSPGMRAAWERARALGAPVEVRQIEE